MITVNDRIKRTSITANDRGPHSVDFNLNDKNEIIVKIEDAAGAVTSYTVDTHYTVASVPGDSPTITFLDSVTVPAGTLILQGDEDYEQTSSGAETDAGREAWRDKTIKQVQQIREATLRALKFRLASTLTDKDFPDFSASESGKFLYVDSNGDLAWGTLSALTSYVLSTIGEDMIQAADAAAVRALLDLEPGTDFYSKAAVDTLLTAYLQLAGGTMTGAIAMGTNKITGMGDPTAAQDAATKNYIDGLVDPLKTVLIADDFVSGQEDTTDNVLATQMGWRIDTSGTGADVALQNEAPSDADHPGVVRLETGTTTSGYAAIAGPSGASSIFLAGGQLRFDWVVYITALADGTDDYEIFCGIADSHIAGGANEGVYFRYDRDTGANWLAVTEADNTATETDTAIAVATGWVRLTAIVNAAGTSVAFYIDGSLVATNTTNINTDEGMKPFIVIRKEAGTTERSVHADLFALRVDLTNSR